MRCDMPWPVCLPWRRFFCMTKRVKILVFAKAPQAGFAKTRLIPVLGAQGAADLARRMLDVTLASAFSAQPDAALIALCVTPDRAHPAWQGVVIPEGVAVHTQKGRDLGERMAHAAKRGLAHGDAVLLIGTDCVEMGAPLLCEAAAMLERTDAVIHMTADGGYAVLGLNRFHPRLFSSMAWGTDTVGDETMDRIAQLGWSLFKGRVLHDVDEPRDLARLLPPHPLCEHR